MKVTKEHYQIMLNACAKYKDQIGRHRNHLINEGKAKCIETRLAWDLFGIANNTELGGRFIVDTLYTYCNDTHVNTALMSILGELQ